MTGPRPRLPDFYDTSPAKLQPKIIPFGLSQAPTAPTGFRVTAFARNFNVVRNLLPLENGDVLVAQAGANPRGGKVRPGAGPDAIYILRDRDGQHGHARQDERDAQAQRPLPEGRRDQVQVLREWTTLVPLSPHGERQAIALGRWFAARPEGERPTAVVASPYLRARRTAELIVEAGGAAGGAASCSAEQADSASTVGPPRPP